MKIVYKIRQYLPVILFVALVYMAVSQSVIESGDDIVFREAPTAYNGIGNALSSLYETWAGRIPILYTTMVILNFPIEVWRVISALIFGITLLVLVYGSGYDRKDVWMKTIAGALGAMLLVAIHPDVWDNGVFWITGCINYLWGAGAFMVSMLPFFLKMTKRHVSKWLYVVACISTIYGCYIEQSAAVAICYGLFCIIVLFIRERKAGVLTFLKQHVGLLILTVFIIINTIIMFSAPGNYVRNESELIQWYQTYDMYDFWDRLVIGFANMMGSIRMYGVWFMIILSAFLVKTCIHRRSWFNLLLSLCIGGYFIGMAYYPMDTEEVYWLYNFAVNLDTYFYQEVYMAVGIALAVILGLAMILLKEFDLQGNSKFISVIFLGAICSGLVMGFSPTMYASGTRVYFIPFLLIIYVIVDVFISMIDRGDIRLLYMTPTFFVIAEGVMLWWIYSVWFPPMM